MKEKNPIGIEEAQERILAVLTKKPLSRKELIKQCVESLGFAPEIMKDKSPAAPLNRARCVLGNAIDRLTENKYILADNDTFSLPPAKQTVDIVNEVRRDAKIQELLLDGIGDVPIRKKELLDKIHAEYQAKYGTVKKIVLHSDTGRLLSNLVKSGEIVKDADGYHRRPLAPPPKPKEPEKAETRSAPKKEAVQKPPKKQSGKTKKGAADDKENGTPKDELYRHNLSALPLLSSEEFVNYSVELFVRYYESMRYLDVEGKNIDGSNDGGIDGTISMHDPLGCREEVIMQMKKLMTPNRKIVRLTEVREFLGVLSASAATRGLFVTNARFDSETVKLVKRYDHRYCVLVDGALWLEIASFTGYRIPDSDL